MKKSHFHKKISKKTLTFLSDSAYMEPWRSSHEESVLESKVFKKYEREKNVRTYIKASK